jgi:hypothetical protein
MKIPEWQALQEEGLDLKDLPSWIENGNRRVSQLVIVQGLSDLGFDLFCNSGDTYEGMTTFESSDLKEIRDDIDKTCGKEVFNRNIAAYIKAATENHRRVVRRSFSNRLQP